MKMVSLIASLLLVSTDAHAYDQYSIRIGTERLTAGVFVGLSGQPFRSAATVLLKKATEPLHCPIRSETVHMGVFAALGGLFGTDFAIENLDPSMSFRTVLRAYSGYSLGTSFALMGAGGSAARMELVTRVFHNN